MASVSRDASAWLWGLTYQCVLTRPFLSSDTFLVAELLDHSPTLMLPFNLSYFLENCICSADPVRIMVPTSVMKGPNSPQNSQLLFTISLIHQKDKIHLWPWFNFFKKFLCFCLNHPSWWYEHVQNLCFQNTSEDTLGNHHSRLGDCVSCQDPGE